MKTGLLVSVRDEQEASLALARGVDVIDLKEPWNGSLGSVDPLIMANVASLVAGRVPLSVALGELSDFDPSIWDAIPPDVTFAKLGLSGCANCPDWPAAWEQALASRRESVAAVAVVYADWRVVAAPPPDEILRLGVALGCRAVLVDTRLKGQGGLFEHWQLEELASFMGRARSDGLLVVLGGSLAGKALRRAVALRPDFVAVRGAVCPGNRAAAINDDLLCEVAGLVRDA